MGLDRSSVDGQSMGYMQVPEEGEGPDAKAPLLMMQDYQQ